MISTNKHIILKKTPGQSQKAGMTQKAVTDALPNNNYTDEDKSAVAVLKGLGIIYGVERLRNSPDPDFYPIGNSWNHTSLPIHNLRKLVKVNFARQVVGVFNQTNINFMEDGTPAVIDGTDGADVVVYNPHMWVVLDGGGSTGMFERWIVGDRAFTYDGDVAIEINPYIDAADNCTLETPTNRLRCVRNETEAFAGSGAGATAAGLGYPRQNISRYNMEIYALNRGLKNYGTFYRDHLVEAALMYIEYKTKNLKAVFGSCGTGWSGAQWTDYNGQNAVLKVLEAHLALSGRADVVSQGHLTGVFTKNFTFATGAGGNINTPFGCYRGKVLRNGLWNHICGIEYEIQSVADGELSKIWLQMNPDLLDANRSDAAFNFKTTYALMGNASRVEGWSKESAKKPNRHLLLEVRKLPTIASTSRRINQVLARPVGVFLRAAPCTTVALSLSVRR